MAQEFAPLTLEEYKELSRHLERKEALLIECTEYNDPEMLNLKTGLQEQIADLKQMLGIE